MTIFRAEKGDSVLVNCLISFKDGTVLENTLETGPIKLELGEGCYPKGFEDAIIGMQIGQKKNCVILAKDAYGSYDPSLLVTLDRSQVPPHIDAKLESKIDISIGDHLAKVRVSAIDEKTITLDGNPIQAGKDLYCLIELIQILTY